MLTFGVVIIFLGLFSFGLNREHFLSALLNLEFIILGNFRILVFLCGGDIMELIVFFLIVIVCEARLGLGLLILGVYFFGRDYIVRYNLLRC